MIKVENNSFSSEKKLQILNFYSDNCPPCHAFMPNFIEAEKTFGEDYDFVLIDVMTNRELTKKFGVKGTPTVAIIKDKVLIYIQAGVPNGSELKDLIIKMSGNVKIEKGELKEEKKERKKFLGIF